MRFGEPDPRLEQIIQDILRHRAADFYEISKMLTEMISALELPLNVPIPSRDLERNSRHRLLTIEKDS